MKERLKKWYRPIFFIMGGALLGLLYYYTIGCNNGSCVITSSAINTMIYMGIMGGLISGIFEKKEEIKSVSNHKE